jgi:phage shock protein PspC (stress-responsive transcriptional regulator)
MLKLYRDLAQQKISGVSAGLKKYFEFDLTIIRIVFCSTAVFWVLALSRT